MISANAESILKKAIRKIPENYPANDFMMEGILRMYETSKDSAAFYRYFKDDALIKMHYPSYSNTADKPQVELIQNRDSLLEDRFKYRDTIRWIGGYSIVTDFDLVYNRANYIAKNGIRHYIYVNQGKGYINHTRVYIINFYSKAKNQIAGTLYIDTASYAFVRAAYTRYNIKELFFITIGKSSSIINYKKYDGKWYVDNIKVNDAARYNRRDLYSTTDYKTVLIDTINKAPISYHDRIQYFTEDIKVNKSGKNEDWLKNKDLFINAEKDSSITKMPAPFVDTTVRKGKYKINPLNKILNYLGNDNYRIIIQLSKIPVSISNYQPLLSKKVNEWAAYTIGLNFQLRLYKELFFQIDGDSNFGIGGMMAGSTNYLLTYNFAFNKRYHPVTLSPLFGYNIIRFSEGGNNYFNQKSIVSGFTLAYELNQRLSYFGGVHYINPLTVYNAGLAANTHTIYPSLGIIYKIK